MRLFLSIAIPDALREQIGKQRELIKQTCFTNEQLQPMRWINEMQYHVTQLFIGEVIESRLTELKQNVKDVALATKVFALATDRYEFKPRHNPRLLWLRFQSDATFAHLMQHLHNALRTAQLTEEKLNDEPIPHLTLIRLKQIKPVDAPLPQPQPFTFNVTHIDLMQSLTKPTGAEYTTLEQFALNG